MHFLKKSSKKICKKNFDTQKNDFFYGIIMTNAWLGDGYYFERDKHEKIIRYINRSDIGRKPNVSERRTG